MMLVRIRSIVLLAIMTLKLLLLLLQTVVYYPPTTMVTAFVSSSSIHRRLPIVTTTTKTAFIINNNMSIQLQRQQQQERNTVVVVVSVSRSKLELDQQQQESFLKTITTTTTKTTTTNNNNIFEWINNKNNVNTMHNNNNNNNVQKEDVTTILDDTTTVMDLKKYIIPFGITMVLGIVSYIVSSLGYTMDDGIHLLQQVIHDPQTILNDSVSMIQNMGTMGIVYFGILYVLAEIFIIPAIPLTVSAGYLFGLPIGIGIVLLSATIAASISFLIGKTILRSYVITNILNNNTKLKKIDALIGERGFSLLLLLRLSPLFPFAVSNYIYGASSIDFISYFWATLLGFAPGTIAYVYTGMVGKELFDINNSSTTTTNQPWYIYGIVFTLILGIMKVISDNASEILKVIDDDDNVDKDANDNTTGI